MSRKIFAAALVLALSFVSQASMLYYTFDGTVNPGSSLPFNTAVHYVFGVDLDLQGYQQDPDGTIYQFPDILTNDPYSVDYFYSDFMGIKIFSDITIDDYYLRFIGNTVDFLTADGNDYSLLYVGDAYNQIQVWQNNKISSWQVGQTFSGWEYASGINNSGYQSAYSTLTLSDISATAPDTSSTSVPEPGMMGMLAMGLLSIGGIGALRRKK
jgi:hypothetical protein